MSITRTLRRQPHRTRPLLSDAEPGIDVSSFTPKPRTVEFRVTDDPPADPFHLTITAWDKLGQPETIRITVEAV